LLPESSLLSPIRRSYWQNGLTIGDWSMIGVATCGNILRTTIAVALAALWTIPVGAMIE